MILSSSSLSCILATLMISTIPMPISGFTTGQHANIQTSSSTQSRSFLPLQFKTTSTILLRMNTAASDPWEHNEWKNEKNQQQRQRQYNNNDDDNGWNDNEELKPLRESEERRNRIQREKSLQDKYSQGADLLELRITVKQLGEKLRLAMRERESERRINEIYGMIRDLRSRDAEYVYAEALTAAREAMSEGREEDADEFQRVAMDARSCIPQFNLEGLWVGKYGNQGYEMINVTYTDNKLIAYKVTGDQNVPKGEITFTADLSPNFDASAPALEPIELSKTASKQFGVEHLIRFPGEGQVASEGYVKKEWIEGQLLMIGDYFSFAWVPIGHQIFFGRPSPELVLRMLRESQLMDGIGTAASSGLSSEYGKDVDVGLVRMRESAVRSYEETLILEEDEEMNEQFFYSGDVGFEECGLNDMESCFQ